MSNLLVAGVMEFWDGVHDRTLRDGDLDVGGEVRDPLQDVLRPLAGDVVAHELVDDEVFAHGADENVIRIDVPTRDQCMLTRARKDYELLALLGIAGAEC